MDLGLESKIAVVTGSSRGIGRGIAARLVVEDRIAPGLAVSIDGVVTSRGLLARVSPDSQVHFLPAFGGG